jgi:hypothetical protein
LILTPAKFNMGDYTLPAQSLAPAFSPQAGTRSGAASRPGLPAKLAWLWDFDRARASRPAPSAKAAPRANAVDRLLATTDSV